MLHHYVSLLSHVNHILVPYVYRIPYHFFPHGFINAACFLPASTISLQERDRAEKEHQDAEQARQEPAAVDGLADLVWRDVWRFQKMLGMSETHPLIPTQVMSRLYLYGHFLVIDD